MPFGAGCFAVPVVRPTVLLGLIEGNNTFCNAVVKIWRAILQRIRDGLRERDLLCLLAYARCQSSAPDIQLPLRS